MQPYTVEHGISWQPGFWRQFPWVAFANILGFVVCCGGLAAILSNSDGKEVMAWPFSSHIISVSVLLSLLVGIANLCLAVALGRGYEISWWTQALEGAELRRLQFDLDIQRRISAIFGQNRAIDKFALAATISLAVSILDGPLIQRASTVSAHVYGPFPRNATVNVWNTSLPANFSAYSSKGWDLSLLTPLFGNVSRAYGNREDIVLPIEACKTNTTCTFTLPATGFDVNCTDELVAYDFNNIGAAAYGDSITNPNPYGNNNQITTFNVKFTFGARGDIVSDSTINASIIYKADPGCSGQIMKRECVMRLATVGNPVGVTDSVATLRGWQMDQNETIGITQFPQADEYDVFSTGSFGAGGFQTMLGGIVFVLNALYSSHFALRIATMTNGYLFNVTGQAASNYLNSDISTFSNCTMTWGDPTADIVNTVRELMLRSAVVYSNYNSTAGVSQQLTIQQTKVSSAYNSHYEYLAITLACMVLQALVIFSLLFGWRHLGRTMSLDAFEVARALGAPLLQGGSTNSSIQEALLPMRHEKFRYGEIFPEVIEAHADNREENVTPRQTRESASPHEVEQLFQRDHEHEMLSHDKRRPRLGLDRAELVRNLRLGVPY